jgi:hypothetical protein
MPRISVLVPAYNRRDTVVACLRSALDGDFQDLEVIVSDNCSTDGTAEAVDEICTRDARVTLVRQERNLGPLPNWRACLDRATAPLTHWLWSDDLVDRNFYSTLLAGMERRQAQMAVCAARIFDPVEGWWYISNSLPDWARTGLDYVQLSLRGNTTLVSPAAALLPTEACRRHFTTSIPVIGGLDCNRRAIGCDVAMMLGAALESRSVYTHPEPLAHFRFHGTSITARTAVSVSVSHYCHARMWWSRRNRLPRAWNKLDALRLVRYFHPMTAVRDLLW